MTDLAHPTAEDRAALMRQWHAARAVYDQGAASREATLAEEMGVRPSALRPMSRLGKSPLARVAEEAATHLDPAPTPLPDPTCPTCKGAGFVRCELPPGAPRFGRAQPCRACKAREQQRRLGQRIASVWPLEANERAFGQTPLKLLPVSHHFPAAARAAHERALTLCKSFLRDLPDARTLALYGNPGAGKSHMFLRLHHLASAQGQSVIYVRAPALQQRLMSFNQPTRERQAEADAARTDDLYLLTHADLLLVDEADDLRGPWMEKTLLELFNARLAGNRATAIAFNIADEVPRLVRSRAGASQPWVPPDEQGSQSSWVDLTAVPDCRAIFGLKPRPA